MPQPAWKGEGVRNASKCNEEVTTWLRRKRLDERVFLTRYMQIRAALVPSATGLRAARRPR